MASFALIIHNNAFAIKNTRLNKISLNEHINISLERSRFGVSSILTQLGS
jgi:hypothetical protein